MPGLDGLRAIAVIGVIAYHLNIGVIPGGLLGVGVFFTLSGYLITDILLGQLDDGGIRLREFWLGRARRLVPAFAVMLIVVLAWITVVGPHQGGDLRAAVFSGAAYVNNWWLILHDASYFAAFAPPSPLGHLWSLSIEEQFYLLWPFALIGSARYIPGLARAGGIRPHLAAATLALAFVSAVLMAVIYKPGLDPSRVYYGTDTRAFSLLIGAALAMMWPSRNLRPRIPASARKLIDVSGAVGLVIIAVLFLTAGELSPFLYRGGFVLLAIATAMTVAALAHPASRLGPLVGCRPLRWIGERSYGIYLWHFPIIVLTTPAGAHGFNFGRAVLQVAATLIIAELSWRFVEDPIRHGALGRLLADLRTRNQLDVLRSRLGAAMATAALIVLIALAGLAGLGVDRTQASMPDVSVQRTVRAKPAAEPSPNQTACQSVVHVGDSTSIGLEDRDYLPKKRERITARYAQVGATTQHFEIQGGRSIYERFEGQPNAEEAAQKWADKGFDGCWVFALGTNEAANVHAGSAIGLDERIDRMMHVAGSAPVMWVNTKSLVPDGPYAATHMAEWDEALLRACDRYPSMRIYDWANDVQDDWFASDGIHFTTPGYAARATLIAYSLVMAFPAGREATPGGSAHCLVHPTELRMQPPAKQRSRSARRAAQRS